MPTRASSQKIESQLHEDRIITEPDQRSRAFIVCDVGKTSIVVLDRRTKRLRTAANQPQPLAAFAAELDAGCFFVCEATGGYQTLLLDAVAQAGMFIPRADAHRVRAFIRSLRTLGKSDAVGARVLARYGQERHAQPAAMATRQPAA